MHADIFINDLTLCADSDITVIAPKDFKSVESGMFEINPDKIRRMIDHGYEQGEKYASQK
jgi:hypothetical protein